MYRVQHGPITVICDSQAEFEHAMDYIRKDLAAQPKAQYPRGMGKALENAMGIQGLVDKILGRIRCFSSSLPRSEIHKGGCWPC